VLILLPPSQKKSTSSGPAIEVYSGVLYQALGWRGLTQEQQRYAESTIAIISAQYGVVRPRQEITAYTATINTAKMRPVVTDDLGAISPSLIVDCRSSTYKSVWKSPIEKTVEIKVFTYIDGVKKVITHMSKKIRGQVVRHLLISESKANNPQELHAIVAQNFNCHLIESKRNQPWILEVYC